jgi:hypothetical protein
VHNESSGIVSRLGRELNPERLLAARLFLSSRRGNFAHDSFRIADFSDPQIEGIASLLASRAGCGDSRGVPAMRLEARLCCRLLDQRVQRSVGNRSAAIGDFEHALMATQGSGSAGGHAHGHSG